MNTIYLINKLMEETGKSLVEIANITLLDPTTMDAYLTIVSLVNQEDK